MTKWEAINRKKLVAFLSPTETALPLERAGTPCTSPRPGTFLNKEQGLAWFLKKTNTGEDTEGWCITIYSDEACTQAAREIVTNQEGKAG